MLIEGPWRHQEILANGIRFHLAAGRSFTRDAPLVLLLHGFGQFWWAWRHVLPILDEAGLSVAALDLRGYGASDKTPRGYRQDMTAADVSGVIRSLGFASGCVVGHDWGGIAAWSTYAYAPEQVGALALVGAPHPLRFPWTRMGRSAALGQLPIVPERMIMARHGALVERLLRQRAAPGSGYLSAADAEHYRRALSQWPSPHCALEYQRMFLRDQIRPAGRIYRRALARPVRVPVLTLRGELDRLVPSASMTPPDASAAGELRQVELPGIGHLPHEEAPEKVAVALIDWHRAVLCG
ncbi:MAG: alpha/beta hydrolase [Microlunatus sp.]|nr:alpha/beta hydrolase [Microlunatus sp.]MDN5770590.1 alpha/beta hydrolase [Microlunatus sp.]